MHLKTLFRVKPISRILASPDETGHAKLERNLNVKDLTAFGIAAVIGGGIFSSIGQVLSNGGPGASLLYVFTAVVCLFSALCYAQFASTIPVAGSAYTYSYAVFGEIVAWIIGWDLLMEYAIGNIAVAISWSDYFTGLWNGLVGTHYNWQFPAWMSLDYVSAKKAFAAGQESIMHGKAVAPVLRDGYKAWITAPKLFNIRVILDIPALLIVIAITWLVFVGIKESKRISNLFVGLKLGIIFLVIIAGSFYVNPDNWSPFAPKGLGGILKGISGVFFAYIGFDAISTTAEECKKPERDLPRAMIYALAICTVIYVLVTLVLSGMVNYTQIGSGDPMAEAFRAIETPATNAFAGIIAVGAVIAMASVFLVFQLGQPRIWMSMSRDGLLPPIFARIHPKYKTPSFSTLLTGLMVGIPALFLNLQEVIDLTSIGTLFAFALVSGGVLIMDKKDIQPKFKVPYLSGRIYIPLIIALVFAIAAITGYWNSLTNGLSSYIGYLTSTTDVTNPSASAIEVLRHKVPEYLFVIGATIILVFTFIKNWSAIPILALVSNLFLMSQLGHTNWERFMIWLAIGLVLYFSYGYKNSKLNTML